MGHLVRIYDKTKGLDRPLRSVIRRSVKQVLSAESVDEVCLVEVTAIDELAMAALNKRTRNVDAVTDVLSFPMGEFDLETERFALGDVLLCLPVIMRQAEALRQSLVRELAYMTVHSVLHLLGYDHMDDAEKLAMREREKLIMKELGHL